MWEYDFVYIGILKGSITVVSFSYYKRLAPFPKTGGYLTIPHFFSITHDDSLEFEVLEFIKALECFTVDIAFKISLFFLSVSISCRKVLSKEVNIASSLANSISYTIKDRA